MEVNVLTRLPGIAGSAGFLPALFAVALLAGCAASGPARNEARIEIQEDVGFVITEEARVSVAVRTGYDEALRLLETGQDAEAIRLLEQAADDAPQLSAPRIDLGIAHYRAGNLKAAEEQLQLALAINPDHPVAHNELGIVYRKTGRFGQARKSYESALAIYPGFHFARRNLAILCDLYLADYECAKQQYDAYLQTAPGDEEAAMWLADLRNRFGNQE